MTMRVIGQYLVENENQRESFLLVLYDGLCGEKQIINKDIFAMVYSPINISFQYILSTVIHHFSETKAKHHETRGQIFASPCPSRNMRHDF